MNIILALVFILLIWLILVAAILYNMQIEMLKYHLRMERVTKEFWQSQYHDCKTLAKKR